MPNTIIEKHFVDTSANKSSISIDMDSVSNQLESNEEAHPHVIQCILVSIQNGVYND